MSGVRRYSRNNFLSEYSFPPRPARDFELDGYPAEFASGHPKEWATWCEAIDFGEAVKLDDQRAYAGFHRILVYDVATKELRATLEGAGQIAFKPAQGPEKPGYTLISSIADNASRGAGMENKL
jgi:hypothetical protein